ncbi:VWA domain-containing protein [Persephonella sp.]
MIEFLKEEFLWLIIPLLFIGWLYLKTGKDGRLQFLGFFTVALLMLLSLAQPVWKKGEKTFYKKDAEIAVLIDRSLSMGVSDLPPDRLSFGLKKVKQLIKALKDEKIAVVVFSDRPYVVSYPYEKNESLLNKLDTVSISPEGSTGMLEAFSVANSVLTGKERIVILVSDGGDEPLDKLKVLLENSGLKLIFWGMATEEGGKVPGYDAVSRLNTEMVEFAEEHGRFVKYSYDNTDVESIASYIKNLTEKTRTVLFKVSINTQLSPFLALTALFVIFLTYLSRRFFTAALAVLLLYAPSYSGELEGYLYYFIGKYERAGEEFLESKTPSSLYNAGLSFFKAGRYDRAESILSEIQTEDPQLRKKVFYTKALCLIAKNDFEKAYQISKQLLQIYPDDEKVKKVYYFLNMVVSLEEEPEKQKTTVKLKEQQSQQPKTSPMEIGDKNPW